MRQLSTAGDPVFEVEVDNWNELMKIVRKPLDVSRLSQPAYLYRGQSDRSWSLQPTLSRIAATARLDETTTRLHESQAMHEFQAQAHQFIQASALPETSEHLVEWWVLMQHYGAVTRLLDWTASPYVAAYFAVANPTVAGALWLVHVQSVHDYVQKTYTASTFDETPQRQIEVLRQGDPVPALNFIQPLLETDRMSAQQTYFSVSPMASCDHLAHIAAAIPAAQYPRLFIKIVIPAAIKPSVMRELRLINVTARTLFPGIDGLGRSIAELVALRAGEPSRRVKIPRI